MMPNTMKEKYKIVMAIMSDDVFSLMMLAEEGADLNEPFHDVAVEGMENNEPSFYDITCFDSYTPLMIAVTEEKVHTAKFLIEFCAEMNGNVNTRNQYGKTAFHYAARTGNIEILNTFKKMKNELGLDVNMVAHFDKFIKTPLDILISFGPRSSQYIEIKKIMVSMGCKTLKELQEENER